MTRRCSILLLLLLAAVLCVPTGAEAAWDLFGEIRFTAGRAENPRLLDPNQPASLRRTQNEGTAHLTFGAQAKWEQTDFAFSYSPYGEFYEESDLNQVSHALGLTWEHRYTPRLSQRLKEDFSYNPKLPTDPNGAGLGGALSSDTSILASDFQQRLSFRMTEKNAIAGTYRNLERIYSSDQLLDTFGNAAGMEYSRTFGPHVIASAGYEFAIYQFRDGLPPIFPAALVDFCGMASHAMDPNCDALNAAALQPSAHEQDSQRHRAYAGYAYDVPAGFHFTVDGGYDFLSFTHGDFDSVSEPFVRSTVGWNGAKVYTRVGYEQGLDEGGGILTNAELRRIEGNGRVRFTDKTTLDLSVVNDVRQALDTDGLPAGTSLRTLRGTSMFTYALPRSWALLATFTHDRQTARGTAAVPTEVRANRYAVGASWRFD